MSKQFEEYNAKERQYMHTLRKRHTHLMKRIERKTEEGVSVVYDKSEAAALRWALNTLAPNFSLGEDNERT